MDARTTSQLRELREQLDHLLRSAGAGRGEAEQSHWHLPVLPPPDPAGRLSSTDLLTWWFRAPAHGSDPWESYFRDAGESVERRSGPRERPLPEPPPERSWLSSATRREPPANELVSHLAPLFPRPEELLAEDHAQAAVEHLYSLLHALGRGEVDAAMALIADDYHAMENDEEIDREQLRRRFDGLVDSLRGWEVEISLAEAPEPIQHPQGILITAELQLDARQPADGTSRSFAERRMALLRQDGAGEWKIHALSLLPR